jgi:hypothetical protein
MFGPDEQVPRGVQGDQKGREIVVNTDLIVAADAEKIEFAWLWAPWRISRDRQKFARRGYIGLPAAWP